ncbi:MAG: HipA domain-containing protein, partial [Methyloversatilis discipulorum]|nr:HipA domain-containing protein [Methyloversatilis discipulorum]
QGRNPASTARPSGCRHRQSMGRGRIRRRDQRATLNASAQDGGGRTLTFNLLITNVDDHLQNHGFLHVAHGQWRLAPAFDINPFPDKDRESKTWLSEQDGPITDVHMLLARAPYFALNREQALSVLQEVYVAVCRWRQVALSPEVGLQANELDDFAPAFEHGEMEASAALLGL